MLRFLRKRREPGSLCPVCGELGLSSATGDWRCSSCQSRIPTDAYLSFMKRLLDLSNGHLPRPK